MQNSIDLWRHGGVLQVLNELGGQASRNLGRRGRRHPAGAHVGCVRRDAGSVVRPAARAAVAVGKADVPAWHSLGTSSEVRARRVAAAQNSADLPPSRAAKRERAEIDSRSVFMPEHSAYPDDAGG